MPVISTTEEVETRRITVPGRGKKYKTYLKNKTKAKRAEGVARSVSSIIIIIKIILIKYSLYTNLRKYSAKFDGGTIEVTDCFRAHMSLLIFAGDCYLLQLI
jgi:hypothetical protein